MDDPLLFEPGTQYFYSSYGFNLLSAAVEGASGHNFLSFMQSEVFDPLGMTSTCADKTDSIILDRTSFYALKEDSVFINAPYVDNSYKWAGGGFISTTRDLIKFGQAHLKPGFLTAETLEKLTSSQELSNGKPTGYGMGWFIREINDKRIIFHGGGSIGGISDFVLYPEDEMVIVMLSNSSHTRYGNVMEKIAELFLESTNK
jgi:CubicO group peptidase (beta-lactamase class C family)